MPVFCVQTLNTLNTYLYAQRVLCIYVQEYTHTHMIHTTCICTCIHLHYLHIHRCGHMWPFYMYMQIWHTYTHRSRHVAFYSLRMHTNMHTVGPWCTHRGAHTRGLHAHMPARAALFSAGGLQPSPATRARAHRPLPSPRAGSTGERRGR